MRASLMTLILAASLGAALPGPAAWAETAVPITAPATAADLAGLMRLPDLFQVMAQEGAAYGDELEAGMFPDRGGASWDATVARLYDPTVLQQRFEATLTEALAGNPDALAEAALFYRSDLGGRIAGLEVEARRILLDKDATEAAEVKAERMNNDRDPRIRKLGRMIEAGQLIDQNVAATLTALLAFNTGVEEAKPARLRLKSEDLQADTLAQEPQIRAHSGEWLITFMVLAYAPLSDEELQAFADFSESPGGLAVTSAVFAAYEAALTPTLRELGFEAGRAMLGHEI